jgi:hypothetical protein
MKLPDDCPYAEVFPDQFDDHEIQCPACCRAMATGYLIGAEEPLCRSRHTAAEAYRFIWRSSFNGKAVVHIARESDSITLRWEYLALRVSAASDAPPIVTLSPVNWNRLQRSLTVAKFWSLDAMDEVDGFDGARWLIEGRYGETYHAIDRWSPRGAVRELGRLFFALAGLPLAEVRLY